VRTSTPLHVEDHGDGRNGHSGMQSLITTRGHIPTPEPEGRYDKGSTARSTIARPGLARSSLRAMLRRNACRAGTPGWLDVPDALCTQRASAICAANSSTIAFSTAFSGVGPQVNGAWFATSTPGTFAGSIRPSRNRSMITFRVKLVVARNLLARISRVTGSHRRNCPRAWCQGTGSDVSPCAKAVPWVEWVCATPLMDGKLAV